MDICGGILLLQTTDVSRMQSLVNAYKPISVTDLPITNDVRFSQ